MPDSTTLMTGQTPLTPRMMMPPPISKLPPINVGDKVRLPEGQLGILRYVGPIIGKSGDFAGVELLGEWSSQGRHNGEFNGYV